MQSLQDVSKSSNAAEIAMTFDALYSSPEALAYRAELVVEIKSVIDEQDVELDEEQDVWMALPGPELGDEV